MAVYGVLIDGGRGYDPQTGRRVRGRIWGRVKLAIVSGVGFPFNLLGQVDYTIKSRRQMRVRDFNKFSNGAGFPDAEMSGGQWHPLVEFDRDGVDGLADEPCLPISEYAEALGKVTQWLVHGGRFQKHGVAVRAVALNYFLQPDFMGIKSQKELASRLGVSEQRVCEVTREFQRTFKFKVRSTYSQP